jgi:hypothetical protein
MCSGILCRSDWEDKMFLDFLLISTYDSSLYKSRHLLQLAFNLQDVHVLLSLGNGMDHFLYWGLLARP